jgi:hypothetical protein
MPDYFFTSAVLEIGHRNISGGLADNAVSRRVLPSERKTSTLIIRYLGPSKRI